MPGSLPYLIGLIWVLAHAKTARTSSHAKTAVVKVIHILHAIGRNSWLYDPCDSHDVIDNNEEKPWREHTSLSHPCLTLAKSETPFLRITPHSKFTLNNLTWWMRRFSEVDRNVSLWPREYLDGYHRSFPEVDRTNMGVSTLWTT